MFLFESIRASSSMFSRLGLGLASSRSSAEIPWRARPRLESHEPVHGSTGYLCGVTFHSICANAFTLDFPFSEGDNGYLHLLPL